MDHKFSKISIVGLGYIGLPTAAMFASRKVEVVGVDVSKKVVDTINRGEVHIVEPELDIVVRTAVREGLLRATTKPEPAEAFLIAVPTPFKGNGREPDLSYIEAASKAIAPVLQKGNLVVLESTSPVGATEAMAEWIAAERPDLTFPQDAGEASDILIAHCPERVLPGKVMHELITNDRVIGGLTASSSERAVSLYKTFVTGTCVIASGPRVAEMAKLTENSFRDVNIAFANELSVIADKLNIDVWELIALANRHPRVNILQPGPGVGGHCIAVDPWFIVSSAPAEAQLIRMGREVNMDKTNWVFSKVEELIEKADKNDIRIACLGLAFKADIDDLRQSPALEICQSLAARADLEILIVEPNIKVLPAPLSKSGAVLMCADGAIAQADIVLCLVPHTPFRELDRTLLEGKIVLDTCAVWGGL
ncbi:UDP-N-acetyl-D-mannosamine dehydrogenase [Qipengyuania flava]|uniref:UDP-N-acetyl-D-mannosamine dehydrogenase n=2 Tax=Qipengyuania flava TaxID=192812 RepID=A0A5P6NHZ8_9SPHN|nr:UDP-N-acetyl-D-mannosamine dehydrogenase [Qipengyuania flava]